MGIFVLDVPCSVGRMVPASMFIYGSILMAVTLRPVVLSSRPVEEACQFKKSRSSSPVRSFCFTAEADKRRHTNDSLADTANHTTRDQDVFCHCVVVALVVHVEVVVIFVCNRSGAEISSRFNARG